MEGLCALSVSGPSPDTGTVTSTILESTPVELRAQVFGALADPTRLRILDLLAESPLCVCDIREAVAIAPNLVSYHLRVLREAGMVEASRQGRFLEYALARDAARRLTEAAPALGAERT
jgi:ArsR family transcriptional regulator